MTLRGDRPEAGAGNPLIGQIGDQDITGLDQAVRHDHRHQGHDHRHQGHDHRHQGHDHRHQGHDHRPQGHDHRHQDYYNHCDDLPPWLDRTVSSKTTISVMIIFVFKIINRATMRREENRDLKKGQPVTEGKHTRKTTNHEFSTLFSLPQKMRKTCTRYENLLLWK